MLKPGKRCQEPTVRRTLRAIWLWLSDTFSQASRIICLSRSYWLRLTLTITVACGWSSLAMAQFGGGSNPQGNSPTISPYINLLRGGNTGLNYYGLVRPQQDFAMQNQQLGQGIQSLQLQQMQQMQQGSQMQMNGGSYGYSQLGMTGHPVIFNSFGNGQFSGGYFGTGGGGIGGGGIGGGGGFNGGGGGFGGGGGQFGGQSNFGGIGTTGGGFGGVSSGFGGVSGHMSQFGGIGNTYRAGR